MSEFVLFSKSKRKRIEKEFGTIFDAKLKNVTDPEKAKALAEFRDIYIKIKIAGEVTSALFHIQREINHQLGNAGANISAMLELAAEEK